MFFSPGVAIGAAFRGGGATAAVWSQAGTGSGFVCEDFSVVCSLRRDSTARRADWLNATAAKVPTEGDAIGRAAKKTISLQNTKRYEDQGPKSQLSSTVKLNFPTHRSASRSCGVLTFSRLSSLTVQT